MNAYIGIDIGSGSMKAVAIDDAGVCVATSKRPLEIHSAPGGVAEQSPETWVERGGECLRELTSALRQSGHDPVAVAATGHMNGPVLLDPDKRTLGTVQMWCDSRCADQCVEIEKRIPPERLLAVTGHTAVTGYTAPKLMWLHDHEPDRLAAARHLILPKDVISLKLTGEVVTDCSDAANTLLFDITSGSWSDEIIDALGLGDLELPHPAGSAEIVGHITAEGAEWSGLPRGTTVAAGAGDSIAGALGAGLTRPDTVQIIIGTAGNVNIVVDTPQIDDTGRVHTGSYVDRNHWIISGIQQSSGASLSWWAGVCGRSEDTLLAEIGHGPKPGSVHYAPYLSGERAPHLDPHVRAAFTGLARQHDRTDMTRAILEGVAFSFRDTLEIFEEIGTRSERAVLCGGGAVSDTWCAVIAAALNKPVERLPADSTGRGAAILAACASGRFASWQEASGAWPEATDTFAPDPKHADLWQAAYASHKKIYPAIRNL